MRCRLSREEVQMHLISQYARYSQSEAVAPLNTNFAVNAYPLATAFVAMKRATSMHRLGRVVRFDVTDRPSPHYLSTA